MARTTLKTSTILAANGNGHRVFRSRDEMPDPLRQQMERSFNGNLAATVLIADPRGRDEILKTLRGESSALNEGVAGIQRRPSVLAPVEEEEAPPERSWHQHRWVRVALALLLPVLSQRPSARFCSWATSPQIPVFPASLLPISTAWNAVKNLVSSDIYVCNSASLTGTERLVEGWVIDVSSRGLRFAGPCPVPLGSAVAIETAEGLLLGEVCHHEEIRGVHQMGILLQQILSGWEEFDPLLTAHR